MRVGDLTKVPSALLHTLRLLFRDETRGEEARLDVVHAHAPAESISGEALHHEVNRESFFDTLNCEGSLSSIHDHGRPGEGAVRRRHILAKKGMIGTKVAV